MLLPDPSFEESVVGGEGVHVHFCVFDCFRIGPQVVRRGRSVEVPLGGVFLTRVRVAGSYPRVGRRQSGSRMYRVLVVLSR